MGGWAVELARGRKRVENDFASAYPLSKLVQSKLKDPQQSGRVSRWAAGKILRGKQGHKHITVADKNFVGDLMIKTRRASKCYADGHG